MSINTSKKKKNNNNNNNIPAYVVPLIWELKPYTRTKQQTVSQFCIFQSLLCS